MSESAVWVPTGMEHATCRELSDLSDQQIIAIAELQDETAVPAPFSHLFTLGPSLFYLIGMAIYPITSLGNFAWVMCIPSLYMWFEAKNKKQIAKDIGIHPKLYRKIRKLLAATGRERREEGDRLLVESRKRLEDLKAELPHVTELEADDDEVVDDKLAAAYRDSLKKYLARARTVDSSWESIEARILRRVRERSRGQRNKTTS